MTQRALSKHSESTQRILKEQSEFIILSEPKILRLVVWKLIEDDFRMTFKLI